MSQATLESVEQLALRLDPQEQLALLEHLAHHLRQAKPSRQPRDLYGVWRGKFPEEFDLDQALREIRCAGNA